jgi:hypothetical protein
MFTLQVIFFSLFPLFFFGLPISGLLFPDEPISERWVKAPFLGLASTVLITQNLVYMDLPLKESAVWVWCLGIILWAIWLFAVLRSNFRPIRFSINKHAFLIGIILFSVYVIQGFGIFGSSAKYYVGRAWYDQYNYVAIAQFLADYPFSTSSIDLMDQPYAHRAITFKDDRIGQSVYHAFVLTSAHADAKSTFEVTILIYPLLTAVAVFWIARSLSSVSHALIAMLWAGILPSLTMIHLESFLSQALGTPFLLIFPFFLRDIRAKYSTKATIAGAIILAAGVSIYAEFLLLYLSELFLVLLAWAAGQYLLSISFNRVNNREHHIRIITPEKISLNAGIQLFANCSLLIISSILLNVGFFQGILPVSIRANSHGILPGIYPWGYTMEGLTRLWFGDWSVLSPFNTLLNFLGVVLIVAAYVGLILNWIRQKTYINFTVLCLCVLPLGLRMLGQGYQYQFYKLILTFSPLFIIGLLYFFEQPRVSFGANRIFSILQRGLKAENVLFGAAMLMILSGGSALSMAYRSGFGKTLEQVGRGGGHLLLANETREIQGLLQSTHDKEILISYWDDFYNGAYLNAWLAYFARNNRVFLTNPRLVGITVPDINMLRLNTKDLQIGSLIITSGRFPCDGEVVGKGAKLVLKNDMFQVHRISGSTWAFIDQFLNPNGIEKNSSGERFMWIGDEAASIVLYSGNENIVSFQFHLYPGLSLPEGTPRTLEISNSESNVQVIVRQELREQNIDIPIHPGRNEIIFRVLERPTQWLDNDPRTLLVNISNLCQFKMK